MQFLIDLIPVLAFFIAFKFYGIYTATIVGIVATGLQVIYTYLTKHRWDKQQCITLVVFLFFGGMTLYFHNPLFVKWKPTVVFWIFAIVLVISQFVGQKPIMQRMMEPALADQAILSRAIWKKLNVAWAVFFAALGCVNLYFAYHFSTDTWVNFKLYGITGLFLFFSLIQALYLSRHAK